MLYFEYSACNPSVSVFTIFFLFFFYIKMLSVCLILDWQTVYSTSPFSDAVLFSDVEPQPIVDEEEGLLWVVGPVLAVIFIISIVILILLFKRWDWGRIEKESDLEFEKVNVGWTTSMGVPTVEISENFLI